MNFYENIKYLCESKIGISLSAMVKELGMSSSFPNKWLNGQIPNGETLIKLADFLDVSTDYLLGREQTKIESTIIPYGGNERIDSVIRTLLSSSIDDNDLHIIEAVLDKYKR